MASWVDVARAIPVASAAFRLPEFPGKYAFFVDDLDSLPKVFRADALTRPAQRLLYIGKADVSLSQRVWDEECQHRRPGTFFRSVGAMLGYRSPKGGRNYEFAPKDKLAIIEWIAERLLVTWDCEPRDGSHRDSEQVLIRQFAPLLNLQGNPRKLGELSRLRAICRAGQG